MSYDETEDIAERMRRMDAEYGEQTAMPYRFIVLDLQNWAAARENPEHDITDAELGARVRMLLAALEAAKTPEKPVDPASISKQVIGVDPAELETVPDASLDEEFGAEYRDPTYGWRTDERA